MDIVGPAEMNRILGVTDALNIHREAVRVPLAPEERGRVRLTGNYLEIVVPADRDFEGWLEELPDLIRELDLSGVKKAENR